MLKDCQPTEPDDTPSFEIFWNNLDSFSKNVFEEKLKNAKLTQDFDEERICQDWLDSNNTFVTAYTITEYAENNKWLNSIEDVEEYDIKYSIFEEFVVL